MKKLALACSLGCLLLGGSLQAQAEDAGHGLVVYGKLQAAQSGCTVLMSKYVVNLHHDEHFLPAQDELAKRDADDRIYIQLGGDACDAEEGYKNIGLKFVGTADNALGNSLANIATGASAAQGVGIRLTDVSHQVIIPNSTVAFFPVAGNTDAHAASFPLDLTLVQLKDQDATAGNIQTNMTVQIERL